MFYNSRRRSLSFSPAVLTFGNVFPSQLLFGKKGDVSARWVASREDEREGLVLPICLLVCKYVVISSN